MPTDDSLVRPPPADDPGRRRADRQPAGAPAGLAAERRWPRWPARAVAAAVAGHSRGPAPTRPDMRPGTTPSPRRTEPHRPRPRRPSSRPTADDALLGFAQSLEFAAAQLYSQALAGASSEDVSDRSRGLPPHHQAYGEQIAAPARATGARDVANRDPGRANARRGRSAPRTRDGRAAGRRTSSRRPWPPPTRAPRPAPGHGRRQRSSRRSSRSRPARPVVLGQADRPSNDECMPVRRGRRAAPSCSPRRTTR